MTEPLIWWGVALFGAALLVLVLELFVPSGGILTLLCCSLVIAGVVCFWRVSTVWGVSSLVTALALGPIAAYFMLRIYPDTWVGRRMILGPDEDIPGAAPASPDALLALVGHEGVAVTELRPVGVIRLGEQRYDASSEFGFIHAGQRIRVSAIENNKIKVRALD